MTDQDKINRHDTLEDLRNRIAGCFGSSDGIFAGHDLDEKRAIELRDIAFENKIKLYEVRNLALSYLFNNGFYLDHIKEQLDKATTFFSKKIN